VTVSPETAAREARRDLSLGENGPVPDILQRIESGAGVNVVLARLPEGGPAGAYTRERGVAFILVNATEPVVRQRFTLAHEFGHHRLGHGDVLDQTIWWGATDPKEAAANRFAAEFLVPVAGVDLWFQSCRPTSMGLETLVRLANAFGVSCETALWRAKAAKRVDAAAADQLKHRLDSREHHGLRALLGLSEIVDTLSCARATEVRVPERMTANVIRALHHDIITEAQAAQRLRLSLGELQSELDRRRGDQEE
jgi:Zn-dependent peptidase ImmA (M78 family)